MASLTTMLLPSCITTSAGSGSPCKAWYCACLSMLLLLEQKRELSHVNFFLRVTKHYPGKRPQTVSDSGRKMCDCVDADDGHDDDDDDGHDDGHDDDDDDGDDDDAEDEDEDGLR